ncbi:MAG: hypothetical protein ACP5LP_03730 [Candidatus Micrarchaeia archaeon]
MNREVAVTYAFAVFAVAVAIAGMVYFGIRSNSMHENAGSLQTYSINSRIGNSINSSAAKICSYYANGSNAFYELNGSNSCNSIRIVFESNTVNSKISCNRIKIIGVTFSNNTFNNSLVNCSLSNAYVNSMHNASNNLINCSGNYTPNFEDNSSSLAIGYYFTFITKNWKGVPSNANYITIAPLQLEGFDKSTMISQELTNKTAEAYARMYNYKMPRFGVYIIKNSSGIFTVPLEKEEIWKNGIFNFSPYWLICPYWGWDVLTFKRFDLNSNYVFEPSLLYPDMKENVLLPANKPIYWNFTIIKYSNASLNFSIYNGWQYETGIKVVFEKSNVSNGTVSYNAGLEKPGIHEFIGMLYSPDFGEQDNSTTETYGVGLAFCNNWGIVINQSGYYPMSSNSLEQLQGFYLNGLPCSIGAKIEAGNVTINCRNGSVYGLNNSFMIENSKNVKIENCFIYGNAINATNSSVYIFNSSLIAKKPSDIAISKLNSTVRLENTKEYNYTSN